jgi:hypothetical protein
MAGIPLERRLQAKTVSTAVALSGLGTRKGAGTVYRAQLLYVRVMMWLIGRLLQAASAVDPVIRREVAVLPADFTFAMRTHSGLSGFALARDGRRLATRRSRPDESPTLLFEFKHVTHAFLVLSFVEGTAQSFANDRMSLGGDAALAMKIVRCLDRLEVVVLPRFIAERGVKHYPDIGLATKLGLALRIYRRFLMDLFGG